MHEYLSEVADWFGASRYAAHSLCLSSDFLIVNLYVLSDLAIMGAYFAIASTIVWHSHDIERLPRFLYGRPAAQGLYAAFIFLCGCTHGTMTLTLFYGVYYLDLITRAATAGVSVATAILTVVAFSMPVHSLKGA